MHEQKDHNLFENMTTKCIYLCGDAAYNKSNVYQVFQEGESKMDTVEFQTEYRDKKSNN